MSIKRNWRAARVIVCDSCGKREPLWRALLPGSGWKYATSTHRQAPHNCVSCRGLSSYRHMGGPA